MTLGVHSNEHFMKQALLEAEKASETGEVPVGVIIVANNRIIAKAHNQVEQLQDVTAHAEMIALTSAQNYLGAKYLSDCRMFVTLEPCVMCAGALYWSQIGEIVVGARDEKRGYSKHQELLVHPKTNVQWDVLKEECESLITGFFQRMRNKD